MLTFAAKDENNLFVFRPCLSLTILFMDIWIVYDSLIFTFDFSCVKIKLKFDECLVATEKSPTFALTKRKHRGVEQW